MAAAGIEGIGGHTVNHPLLSRLDERRSAGEIAVGQRRIIGRARPACDCVCLSCRSGQRVRRATKAAVAEAGFQLSIQFSRWLVRRSTWDPLDVPRTYVATGTGTSSCAQSGGPAGRPSRRSAYHHSGTLPPG